MDLQEAIIRFMSTVGQTCYAMTYPACPLFIFFSLGIFPFRFSKRRQGWIVFGVGVLCGGLILGTESLFKLLMPGVPVSYLRISLISVVLVGAVSLALYEGNRLLIALTALLHYNLFSTARFFFVGLLEGLFPELSLLYRIEFSIVPTCLVALGICLLILRVQKVALSGLSRKESVFWFCLTAMTMVMMCFQVDYPLSWWQGMLSAAELLVTNAAIYCLIHLYSGQKFVAEEQRKILSNMEQYRAYLDQMQELNSQISAARHEVKNHIYYIDELLREQDYDSLRVYVDKVKESNLLPAAVCTTGNAVIDAIVNQKCAYARSLGIRAEVHTAMPEEVRIDQLSLCSVLGNILNNAIEGAQGASPWLRLEIKTFKDYFVVTTENSVDRDVMKENPRLLTTKKDAENHGIGLKVVRQVSQWYEGNLRLEMVDKRTFRASVMMKNLPLKAQKD